MPDWRDDGLQPMEEGPPRCQAIAAGQHHRPMDRPMGI
jgi:hypothetical protein